MKNSAGLYVRVSTMNQIDKDSLITQQERLISYCKAHGIKKTKIYKDAGCSAKNTDRPSLQKLIKDVKSGEISCILVTKLDRITRSIKDLIQLVEYFDQYNASFISISESIDTSNAMGRFMQNLLGILAQLEREMTAERVSTDMYHRAEKGKWNGGIVPFGYATQALLINRYKNEKGTAKAYEIAAMTCPEPKKLYIFQEEAEIIRLIFKTFLETNSIRGTGITLNNQGIKTRNGALWPQSTIHRILKSPIYIGKIWYGKRKTSPAGKLVAQAKDSWTIVDGEHEPIISEEEYFKVQSRLKRTSRKPAKKGKTYLLSGILRCGLCGGVLSGHTFKKKNTDKQYSYYKCTNRLQKGKKACQGLSLPADNIEEFIIQSLSDLSKNQDFLSDKEKMVKLLKSENRNDELGKKINQIEKSVRLSQKKLDTLLGKLEAGVIDDDDFTPRYRKIKTEIENMEQEKIRINKSLDSKQSDINNLEIAYDTVCSFSNNWDLLEREGKKLRIQSIVKEIRATKEEIEMDIFFDVDIMSRRDTDSWQPPA